jgi:hypothetical protein
MLHESIELIGKVRMTGRFGGESPDAVHYFTAARAAASSENPATPPFQSAQPLRSLSVLLDCRSY